MRRASSVVLGLGLLLAAASGQARGPALGRSVHGVVLNAENQPLPTAIVYLKNLRTKVIHTAITDDRGSYSFHQLEANVSYEVYAVWKQHRSPSRTDSEYETQPDIRLDLKVPVG